MNNVLPECREHRDLSQGALAEGVGVTRQTINAIERERYDPSLDLAFALADFFDCSIEDLFTPSSDYSSERTAASSSPSTRSRSAAGSVSPSAATR